MLRFTLIHAVLQFIFLCFTASLLVGQVLQQDGAPGVITPPEVYEDKRWGASIALKNEALFIGVPGQYEDEQPGVVQKMTFNGSEWVKEVTIESPNETYDGFGGAVAATDSLLVVGAPYAENEDGEKSGQVYVFQEVDEDWRLEYVLTDEYLHDDARFGYAVAADSARIIVGAPGRVAPGNDELEDVGRAYGFDLIRGLDDEGHPQSYSISASLPSEREQFGYAVDIKGDFAVVTSVETGMVIGPRNRAFLYKQNERNPGWSVPHADLTLEGHNWPDYGIDAALGDEHVIIGHPKEQVQIDPDNSTQAGSVYSYTDFQEEESVSEPEVVSPGIVRSFLEYGSGVAIHNNELAVIGRDMVELYNREDQQWRRVARMDNPNTDDINFGSGVEINSEFLIASAFDRSDDNGGHRLYWQHRDEVTSSETEQESVAAGISLNPAYPNPFNPTTTITYTLDTDRDIELQVYNTAGEQVATLHEGRKPAGEHTVSFNGSDLASGIYLYRLTSGSRTITRKMTLIK